MKSHSSPACESSGTSARGWLRLGSEETSERLYWVFSPDLLFAAHPSFEGHFVYEGINPAFELRLGVSSEEIREMDVFNCLGSDDARAVSEALRACLAEGTEVRIRHRLAFGGQRQNMVTTIVPIMDADAGGAIRLIGSHRIARNERFQNATERSDAAQASVNLLSIQEEIQQRIASDLHDSTCQHLIAASLGLMRIRQTIGDPVRAERICDEIDASIDEALREIRAFAYLLHPQNLTDNGLKVTIEHYADGFAARTSLRVTTRIVAGVDRLPYEKQRSLLRVVQEALTNVFRHAKATEVSIVIKETGGHFRLTVRDNGRGLQAGRTHQAISTGVGIPAMKARLEQIGGSLEIHSDPAAHRSGTVLCAVVPHAFVTNRRN
ncbi:PAS domain-containing sensor histidine kinase [Bradyrhizobium frederickii]|uniref:PAS domain-containing sensor histidine kinase n=1 Tax=Bradyrhizobium frederickii TaxID=2560054 RepID=A0A4Y9NRD9_9BRAD|nr:ATP-binding protein [Bradyrhizobium frederickii]TFV70500.1 PAS domain-containing sensor histidine kinase [Bradyrhizobium frederickii]